MDNILKGNLLCLLLTSLDLGLVLLQMALQFIAI